jgi:diaminopimelate epimerase
MHGGDHVRFEKYDGTGNDFLVVEGEAPVPDRPAFARRYCDRHAGVSCDDADPGEVSTATDGGERRTGADGVLFLGLVEEFAPTRVVTTLVKPDGTVAATTGNGARCAAAWAADRTGEREFMLDTPAGSRRARVDDDDAVVTVEMGTPSFAPRRLPLADGRTEPLVEERVGGLSVPVTVVDAGTPHAVAFVDDVDEADLASIAPAVRQSSALSGDATAGSAANVNVTVASPVGDADEGSEEEEDANADGRGFRKRTFEFGVEGETRSCGTAAVAVVAAGRRLGLVDDPTDVPVHQPGGSVRVSVPDEGTATLRGPVVREFAGALPARPDTGS